MSIYAIPDGGESADIRSGLNGNAAQLRLTRRPWASNFDGSHCTHNGKDYDLAPGGVSSQVPGNPTHWTEKQYLTVSSQPVSGLQRKRGSLAELKAEPANSTVDKFIVEGESINSDNENMNGEYDRTASGVQFIWVKE